LGVPIYATEQTTLSWSEHWNGFTLTGNGKPFYLFVLLHDSDAATFRPA